MAVDLRVTIWNEGVHEERNPAVRAIYPEGMGHQIAQALAGKPGIASVEVVQLNSPDHGVTEESLAATDVLVWWGHLAHDEVPDEKAALVQEHVVSRGMGAVFLHSAHFSKPFKRLMGTSCDLKWREWEGIGEKERLWVVDPAHPIAEGLPEYFELPRAEMYGEHFDIPAPDDLVFISWFQGGEVFRSGCCWRRGLGKVFYFRPGHETLPIYHDDNILRVVYNGVRWVAPTRVAGGIHRGNREPLEPMG